MRYTKEQFIQAVQDSKSYAEVCRQIGLSPKGGNLNTIKKKIILWGLDSSHFTGALWSKGKTFIEDTRIRKTVIQSILKPNSGWSTHAVKQKLLKEGLKEHKCENCGLEEWLGQPIPIQLHHINGIRDDHTFENLQILCPNCHAQTDNYCGKKK